MSKELDEKFVSDDEISEATDIVVDKSITESFADLFEGTDLSEEFKSKVSLVFEAAVNEAVAEKAKELEEQTNASLEEASEQMELQVEAAIAESIEEIVENLDKYLDYVVSEWVTENKLEIESGVKVEMAESLLEGLKDLFETHNIDVSDEKMDIVSALEEQAAESKETVNSLMNSNIDLKEEVQALKAELVFKELSEGMTVSQVQRLRTLSENIDITDLEKFTSSVTTLKESFFANKDETTKTVLTEEAIELKEEIQVNGKSFDHDVNALVNALNSVKI